GRRDRARLVLVLPRRLGADDGRDDAAGRRPGGLEVRPHQRSCPCRASVRRVVPRCLGVVRPRRVPAVRAARLDRRRRARDRRRWNTGPHVTEHRTGTREEWLAARLELLEAEKELTRRGDELARQRQELPWVRIDKEYRFETDEGGASLADLFRGRSQLLMYHFMFGPEYTAGCPACSAIADGFNGSVVHLENHDVAMIAVSRAPLEKLQAYKRRMGWSFPWASSYGTDFNYH